MSIEVNVWSEEKVWNKRHIEIDCTIEEAKKMTSEEFEGHIVEYLDIIDTDSHIFEPPEYDFENMEQVKLEGE
jgi:hypothetical protein